MSTLYMDLEAGNDSNAGTSFALRFKTFDTGATAARTAPGDTVRIMASQTATSLGTCLWTNKTTDAQLPGTSAINTASDPTVSPISITTTAAHGFSTGDIVQITGQTGQRYINGLWEITVTSSTTFTLKGSLAAGGDITTTGTARLYTSRALKLSTACNKSIDMCEVGWTASANVTAAINGTSKQGDASMLLTIAAGFTTGLAAYRALPSTIDLSGYQQVTFWIRTNTNIPASNVSLRLCSDAAGVTTVNTITVPAITGLNVWVPVTVDTGGNLGSSIASVAFYVDTDFGGFGVLLDNISAVKSTASADSLGLQSLVGKNTSGETFYPLATIEETVLAFDSGQSFTRPASYAGYYGTSESVTTYKIEPIQLTMVASGTNGLTTQEAGTAGNQITYSGGWNRTDMTTQTGMTCIDCRNCLGSGIVGNHAYLSFDHIGIVRGGNGFTYNNNSNGYSLFLDEIHCNGCGNSVSNGINTNGGGYASTPLSNITATNIYACNNGGGGISIGTNAYAALHSWSIKKVNCNGELAGNATCCGITINGFGHNISIEEACGNRYGGVLLSNADSCNLPLLGKLNANVYGFYHSGAFNTNVDEITHADANDNAFAVGGTTNGNEVDIYQATSDSNTNTFLIQTNLAPAAYSAMSAILRFRSLTATDTSPVSSSSITRSRISVDRWGDADDAQRIYVAGGNVVADTSVRHTASGISWKISPTSNSRIASVPIILPLAAIACNASALVTVKAWVRRTNTGLTIGIVAPAFQLAGMPTDATATISAAADTWEQLTITFTPSTKGVVQIDAFCYGGTTFSGYIDDMTITQA